MKDLHILEFHEDIVARYIFATKICPQLKRYGYKNIALEGFIVGDTIENHKSAALAEVEETKKMLRDLDLEELTAPWFASVQFNNFTFQSNLLKEIPIALLDALLKNPTIQQHMAADTVPTLSTYIVDSLINLSIFNLLTHLQTLDFELFPLDDPESCDSLRRQAAEIPIGALSDKTINQKKQERESCFNKVYHQIKHDNGEPVIILTGANHYKAIQSPNIKRLFITACPAHLPKELSFTMPVTQLDLSTENFNSGLRRAVQADMFSVTHFDKTGADNYLSFFCPEDTTDKKIGPASKPH
jgi:hypothetical protein